MNPIEIDADLLRFQSDLQVKKEGNKLYIFDPIRQKYLVQNNEEVVRQLCLCYLENDLGWPIELLAVEKMLVVNERRKRFDILGYDRGGEPALLVECKSPKVPITFSTFEQISSYNIALKVPHLVVTNGISTYCCRIDFKAESFEFLTEVPSFAELSF